MFRICSTNLRLTVSRFNIAAIGWIVGFASSIDSAALLQAAADFGVSEVTESLATGLFLIGFGVGALVAGPISETVGRNPVYIATLSLYMIFVMASGLAPNIGAQLVFRFIAGCFAATPLTCAGGSISDLWNPMERVRTLQIHPEPYLTLRRPLIPLLIKCISKTNSGVLNDRADIILNRFMRFQFLLTEPSSVQSSAQS